MYAFRFVPRAVPADLRLTRVWGFGKAGLLTSQQPSHSRCLLADFRFSPSKRASWTTGTRDWGAATALIAICSPLALSGPE
jgi:hypothetical protein